MRPSKPRPQENQRIVIRRAFESFASRSTDDVAAGCGGSIDTKRGGVTLDVMGRPVRLDLEVGVVFDASGEALPDFVAAPVVRYVALSAGLTGGDRPVAFAEVADARGYEGPFRGRVLAPFLSVFGRAPDRFARAAESLGAKRARDAAQAGGIAYAVRVFPKVELVFVLDAGDEELPPAGQVLFPRELFGAFAVDDAVAMADFASRALRGKHPVREGG